MIQGPDQSIDPNKKVEESINDDTDSKRFDERAASETLLLLSSKSRSER